MFNRAAFLRMAAAVGALGAAPERAWGAQPMDRDHPNRVERALALSGGGARGAYEGGIIDYLVQAGGIRDGEPLTPYGFVCGTSIGALNGYFVATAQYSKLRELWYTIAQRDIVRLKPQYAKIVNLDAGVGDRVAQAVGLGVGAATNVTGVIDGTRVRDFIAEHAGPNHPVVMPFAWTVTNLTRAAPEYFYLAEVLNANPELRNRARIAVRATVGPSSVLREATPDLLVPSLQASAALPIAFDPVVMPAADGSGLHQYCDGGVTENTPIGIARAAAENVDVVMMDPPRELDHYVNALEVGLGAFGTLQRVNLEANVRSAYFESLSKRAFQRVPLTGSDAYVREIETVARLLFASDFYVMRPNAVLPVSVGGFNDVNGIYQTYVRGFNDARNGFTKFEFNQAELEG